MWYIFFFSFVFSKSIKLLFKWPVSSTSPESVLLFNEFLHSNARKIMQRITSMSYFECTLWHAVMCMHCTNFVSKSLVHSQTMYGISWLVSYFDDVFSKFAYWAKGAVFYSRGWVPLINLQKSNQFYRSDIETIWSVNRSARMMWSS